MSNPPAPPVAAPVITDSKQLPPAQGSFVLQSNDGVRFHVAPYLLQHASGFFRDLLSLPGPADGTPHPMELTLEMKSFILHDLLCLIDVNKPNPPLDASGITHLMEAARFCQIPCIVAWFQEAVFLATTDAFGVKGAPFIKRHPLIVLSISHSFGLRNCFNSAMYECITCGNIQLLRDVHLELRLYRYLLSLRRKRTEMYQRLIGNLLWNRDDELDEETPVEEVICTVCTVRRTRWFARLTTLAFERPHWEVIRLVLYDPPICNKPEPCPSQLWVAEMKKVIDNEVYNGDQDITSVDLPRFPSWLEEELAANSLLNPQ